MVPATLTINGSAKNAYATTISYANPNIPVHDPFIAVPTRMSDLMDIIGGLSEPSKMPGYSYSISAFRCNVGGSLRNVENSTCKHCYACKGNYVRFPAVQISLERRYESLFDSRWTAAFIAVLNRKTNVRTYKPGRMESLRSSKKFFRWHDSGDLQSFEHLLNIVNIAIYCPDIKFWLPTREYALVDRYLREVGEFPQNLTVRVSAHIIDKTAPSRFRVTSAVLGRKTTIAEFQANNPELYFAVCPAPDQGGECRNCRSCWNSAIRTVVYKEH
jgi:hypothetical protein